MKALREREAQKLKEQHEQEVRQACNRVQSFKRNGELFGQPRIIFQSSDASDVERASYHTAVAETLKRCASLPFTEAFGNGMAGQPFTLRFVHDPERAPG